MSTRYLTDAAQDPDEIAAFCALLAREGVRSYLEIGSKFGGSLWRVGEALAPGARIVSVDMPGGTKAWKDSEVSLKACHAALADKFGHETHAIWGDSSAWAIIGAVEALGPFDAILIDADHRLPGVTRDWLTYGPMGRIVAFHDLAWRRAPDWVGTRIDVPQLWASIKDAYRHEEIICCPTGKNNGIGVLWTR